MDSMYHLLYVNVKICLLTIRSNYNGINYIYVYDTVSSIT